MSSKNTIGKDGPTAFLNRFSLTQQQKLRLTSSISVLLQLVTLAYGFILPRLFLSYYGSAVNGLVSSIAQFLGLIALAECGVGAVVRSALYKPLANKDHQQLSLIVISAEHFFRQIAKILLVYTFILMIVYPFIVRESFDYLYTASLIAIVSISSFAQYYFGITYRLLLASDQFGFIPLIIQIIALILNLIISVILMKSGFPVHVVKFFASIIFLLQPLAIFLIARKWYHIDNTIKPNKKAIPQKWNGFAQHLSAIVLSSTSITVLSVASTMENVSVYAIYSLVVIGIKNLIDATTNGMQAYLGNLFAKEKHDLFNDSFDHFEWQMHTLVSLFFMVTASLIVPFVWVYTKGITDVNYIVPAFAILLCCAQGMYCLRLPYNIVVLSIGHYKQTQNSAIIEMVINILLTVFGVLKFGLIGAALGTLFAMIYRTTYLAWYISKNILHRKIRLFVKHLIVDAISVITFFIITKALKSYLIINEQNYLSWFILATKTFLIGLAITIMINLGFYKKNTINLLSRTTSTFFQTKKHT